MSGGRTGLTPRVRQARIAALVRKRGRVTVEALAARFDASHETIRRDLALLAEAGVVMKVHGGAKLPRRREEGAFEERMAANEAAKREIAAKAAGLLGAGETIFVDTGSTTLMCAEEASRIAGLTVVTNSPRVAAVFGRGEGRARVFLAGGSYDPDYDETVGPMTIAQLRGFHADHAILGVGALDARAGAMNVSFDEAQVAQTMMEQADRVIMLADSSKFDRRAAFAVCPLEGIDHLVCERPPEGALAEALTAAGVNLPGMDLPGREL